MAKRTAKYSKALEVAQFLKIAPSDSQEILYRALNEHSWFWDSDRKVWEEASEIANPPSNLIKVRVWAESSQVGLAADTLVAVYQKCGYELLEKSSPYICRPPQQLESRIYLSFKRKDFGSSSAQSSTGAPEAAAVLGWDHREDIS